MGRQIRLCVAAAGNGCDDGGGTVSVAHIVLKNDYGAAAFLLRADTMAQITFLTTVLSIITIPVAAALFM